MVFTKISIFAILISTLLAFDADPSIEKKINDYEEFTYYMDKLRTLKDSEHKYKIIHSKMTYKKSWFI